MSMLLILNVDYFSCRCKLVATNITVWQNSEVKRSYLQLSKTACWLCVSYCKWALFGTAVIATEHWVHWLVNRVFIYSWCLWHEFYWGFYRLLSLIPRDEEIDKVFNTSWIGGGGVARCQLTEVLIRPSIHEIVLKLYIPRRPSSKLDTVPTTLLKLLDL